MATTVESFHGRTPPVPSVADFFYLGFYPLAYVAVVIFLRAEVRGLSRSSWLDGLVAGLGAASVCATYAFHGILSTAGGEQTDVGHRTSPTPSGTCCCWRLLSAGTNLLPRAAEARGR